MLAVAGALVVLLWPRNPGTRPTPAAAAPQAVAPAAVVNAKSIAVLPFVNMSDSKDNAYFADGVQEDILTGLALLHDALYLSGDASTSSIQRERASAQDWLPIRLSGR